MKDVPLSRPSQFCLITYCAAELLDIEAQRESVMSIGRDFHYCLSSHSKIKNLFKQITHTIDIENSVANFSTCVFHRVVAQRLEQCNVSTQVLLLDRYRFRAIAKESKFL